MGIGGGKPSEKGPLLAQKCISGYVPAQKWERALFRQTQVLQIIAIADQNFTVHEALQQPGTVEEGLIFWMRVEMGHVAWVPPITYINQGF